MTLAFLFDYPISERDARRCGFDLLTQKGFSVEAWDVAPYIRPDVDRYVKVPDPLRSTPVRRMESAASTAAALAALPPTSFLFLAVYYQWGSLSLYRAIGRYRLRYGVVVANALPRPAARVGRDLLLRRLARVTPRKLVARAFGHLPLRALGVPPASLVVAGGEESLASQDGFYPIARSTEVIWAHSLDYDQYLDEIAVPREVGPRQAVFLDEYVPFHPDYHYLRMAAPSTPEAYYPRLCDYFAYLEREHGVEVVIAAHPRSEYEKHPDYFCGRPVIRGRTPELVRTSSLVIAHSSTALSYAVMFERPVVFVTTDAIDRTYLGAFSRDLASRFGSPRINLDQPPATWCGGSAIDRAAYARYRAAYIKKPGAAEARTWEIVSARLEATA